MAREIVDIAGLEREHERQAASGQRLATAVEGLELPRTLVVMPTYQEAATIGRVLRAVRGAAPFADVLVVDDGSPDGTARIANDVGAEVDGVHVLRRTGKQGLGSAYREGLLWGLDHGYEALATMDGDGSHPADALAVLVQGVADGADVVLGSRYVPEGATVNWPVRRYLLSRWGNRYATAVLRLDVCDATAGYRAYSARWLRTFDLRGTSAWGFGFHLEMTYLCARAGARIVERPITFTERTEGLSKMSGRIVAETFSLVTGWAMRDRLGIGA